MHAGSCVREVDHRLLLSVLTWSLTCSCDFVVPSENLTTKKHEPARNNAKTFLDWLKKVSPGMTWDWKYQQYVYKQLERVTMGLCKRLMIFMPPRHGKSELVTQRYAAWRLKKDPKMRVVVASYNQKLANRFSRGIRRILHHDRNAETAEHAEHTWVCLHAGHTCHAEACHGEPQRPQSSQNSLGWG